MSDELDRFDESLSAEALERIEPVCQAFEDAWNAGQRPEIKLFLGDFEDDVVWNANAILYLGKLGIGLQAEIADDIDTYNAFLRFNLK